MREGEDSFLHHKTGRMVADKVVLMVQCLLLLDLVNLIEGLVQWLLLLDLVNLIEGLVQP